MLQVYTIKILLLNKKSIGKMPEDIFFSSLQTHKFHELLGRKKVPTVQKRNVKHWTAEQDQLLFQLYGHYPKKWEKIAQKMKNRNHNQCLHRYRRLTNQNDNKKNWSQEEDQKVIQMVKKYGKNWKTIATHMGTKTGKQIRERYINTLDDMIKKEPWSQAEDFKLIELYTKLGSKWTEIGKQLPGRPENKIKNRFHSYIVKNYNVFAKEEKINEVELTLQNSSESKFQMFEEEKIEKEKMNESNLRQKVDSDIYSQDYNIEQKEHNCKQSQKQESQCYQRQNLEKNSQEGSQSKKDNTIQEEQNLFVRQNWKENDEQFYFQDQ